MSAKAQVPNTLVNIILVLAGIALLTFLVFKVMNYTTGVFDKHTCRTSVLVRGYDPFAVDIAPGPWEHRTEPHFEFKCTTQQVLFDKGKVSRNKEKFQSYTDAREVIASEMNDCWYSFLEGRADPFGSTGDESRCFLCAEIQFKEELEIDDFKRYLSTNPNAKDSYAQYLYKQDQIVLAPETLPKKGLTVLWTSFDNANAADHAGLTRLRDYLGINDINQIISTSTRTRNNDQRFSWVTVVPTEDVRKYCNQIL